MLRFTLVALMAAAAFAESIPRPEHPQPQFEREQWMNLNGQWEFDFDDGNVGMNEHWESGSHKFSRGITVPFCFESKNSGIGDTAFHPWVVYRRAFSIPSGWKGKHVLLHFGAVDYRAQVWMNGQAVGMHEGGNVSFTFDITPYLNSGENILIVRAWDPPTDRYIPRGKQYWEPKSRSIFYTRTTGIWQTVWLEPVERSYLDRVQVTPNMEGMARIQAHLYGAVPDLMLRTTISYRGKTLATNIVSADNSRVATSISVSEPRLWSPDAPNLYDLTFELVQGDKVLDHVKSYTGFRSVDIENGRVALNHRPIYLKMVLDQGYWPESTLTPPTDEAIQYDIRLTKEMGFNGVRKHQKLEDPRYLYWADKMGLLVSSEMANAYLFDDQAVARFTREWTEAVARDYNHPSIIIWVPINESWGVPNLHERRQQNYLKTLYALTHALDNSRLVIDNDGWEHTDMTDLFALHDYAGFGEALAEKYKGTGVPDNARPALAPGFRYNGTPLVLSEFGGIAYIPPGHEVPPESWGYSGIEKTESAVLERLRGLYDGISKTRFVGICYTQLTDVEQEINGLLTYDRKPKFDVKKIREINGMLH